MLNQHCYGPPILSARCRVLLFASRQHFDVSSVVCLSKLYWSAYYADYSIATCLVFNASVKDFIVRIILHRQRHFCAAAEVNFEPFRRYLRWSHVRHWRFRHVTYGIPNMCLSSLLTPPWCHFDCLTKLTKLVALLAFRQALLELGLHREQEAFTWVQHDIRTSKEHNQTP